MPDPASITVDSLPPDVLASKQSLARALFANHQPLQAFSLAGPRTPAPARNVVGVGVGYDAGELVLDIYVVKKFPDNQIPPDQMLPKHNGKQRTRVRECNYLRPLQGVRPPGDVVRPIVPGIGVGPLPYPNATGTLGGILTDGTSKFVLSNNHVLAAVNTATAGTSVVQPGAFDGGGAANGIAQLSQYVTLVSGPPMEVDCAIAQIDAAIVCNNVPAAGVTITGVTAPALHMQVEKFGRTTGHTEGTIDNLAFQAPIPYDDGSPNGLTVNFVDQVTIVTSDGSLFSDHGDSGSVILEKGTGRAVGLLVAGSSMFTMANDIRKVLAALGGLTFA